MKLLYYVTNHGFGHGVRTTAICNALSPGVELIIRTSLSEAFFHEEVRRPMAYTRTSFDCGCIQKDSVSTDIGQTFAAYQAMVKQNSERLASEVEWCRQLRPDVIVSDIVPFAFEVAKQCNIPSIAVSNFTWYDIYEPYMAEFPAWHDLLEHMKEQYASADLLLALEPALPMTYFKRRRDIPPVGRLGRNRRTDIVRAYNLDPGKRLGLIYLGELGIRGFEWRRLASFAEWEFLGIMPIAGAPKNYHCIARADFAYQDILASVDCMICKLGYASITEAMLHGTPLIYLPRTDFAEWAMLEKAVRAWGGGCMLSAEEFGRLEWSGALDAAVGAPRPRTVASDGARQCARSIEGQACSG